MRREQVAAAISVILSGLVVFCLYSVFTPHASAVQAQSLAVGEVDAYGYESVTISSTAIGLTNTLVNPPGKRSARVAFCTQETADIRYRYDGTNPSSVEGHVSTSGSSLTIVGINNINRFRAIKSGVTDAKLKCTVAR